MSKQQITKEILEDLYFNQKLSQRKCAEKLGVSASTITCWFKKYKIKNRNQLGNKVKVKCAYCDKEKEIYRSKLKHNKSGFSFCNKGCRYKFQRYLTKKFQDLTGLRFGNLIVKKEVGKDKRHQVLWLCECDCGKSNCLKNKIVATAKLNSGDIKNCGCSSQPKKLLHKRFGRLIAIKRIRDREKKRTYWLCKCDCGTEKMIAERSLIVGETKSCGCLLKDINNANSIGNGKYYGYETAKNNIGFAEEIRRDQYNNKAVQVRCSYCNRWFLPSRSQVDARTRGLNGTLRGYSEGRFYCSESCKFNCPIYHQKDWPKGFKPTTSREVVPELRQLCFERDDWTCQKCGSTENLHCHHIEGYTQNKMIANDLPNVITLCKKCHKEVHKLPGCHYHELRCVNT